MLANLLSTAVCGISVGGASVSGTGWLAAPTGIVLTAGHLLTGAGDLKVTFPGHGPLRARVLVAAHQPAEGIDFAVLDVDLDDRRIAALPIALAHAPRGSFASAGFGVTLRTISAGAGDIIGPFDPRNDASLRLFRCRSQELAEPGYSGAPIVSTELGAVVGIQIEAVTGPRGARDTVLAMPLYRVASAWNRLEEIEAQQAAGSDSPAARQVMVVATAIDTLADRIAAELRVRGLAARSVFVSDGEIPKPNPAVLADVQTMVLVANGMALTFESTRELVVAAVFRQLVLIVVADEGVALPTYLRSFVRVSAVGEAVAAAVSAAADAALAAKPASLADALEDIQSHSSAPGRFQPRIDELRSAAEGWSSRRERQERRLEALAESGLHGTGALRADVAPAVGVRPFDPQHLFRDRVHETGDISRALADDSVGVVSVIGRAGVGKTALAARVLSALRSQHWFHSGSRPRIDGVVFLSTRTSSGISSDEIVLKLAQLTGDADLFRTWSTRAIPLHRRVASVLEVLDDRHVVVLLDNLEDLLDGNGRLTGGDELDALLTELMLVASPVSFLITSREQVQFSTSVLPRTRCVELRAGLPDDESVRMLRELDAQAEYGLADAPDDVLRRLATAVHGLPRALQLIAGMLASDPLLTVDDLVTLDMPAVNESLGELIAETLARLDRPARWVLLALAVVGRPMATGGVDFILRPFAPGLDVPSLVRRLVRTQIVSGDRTSKTVALHPADRRYLLRQAAEQQEATVALLHRRAADHYLRLSKATADPRDIDDVRPMLFASEHLLNSGDHHQAAEVLDEVGGLLENIGQYRVTADLARSLADVAVGDDWVRNAMRLGRLYWLMGEAATSLDWLAKAEAAATTNGDHRTLPAILVDLGASQRDSGSLRASLRTFRRALHAAAQQGDGEFRVVARGLVQLTHTLRPMGFLATSVSCAERAMALVRRERDTDPTCAFLTAGALINAAVSDSLLGLTPRATTRATVARDIARHIGDRGLEAYADCVLAGLARVAGAPDAAVPLLLGALETYEEIGDRWGLASGLATLSWTLTDLLDVDAAESAIRRCHMAADGCNPRAAASVVLAESVLARRQGDLTAAVRLAGDAASSYDRAAFHLYGAWARCELVTALFLLGEPVPSAELFVRATPLTKAAWHTLRVMAQPIADGADQTIGTARAALARVGQGTAWQTLPAGWLAAVESCRTGADPPAEVGRVFEVFGAAPGVMHDHRQVLGRLADHDLPGSPALRRLLS
ncbi:trypsin-like peptidase domain-containing protein [Streptomyces griseiscabiei]|uniref:trypsin-like peptidase domain-containing protein n=1 Tax=Streptomyces griseiscabiei TaxID=2993540 RepID=UPI001C4F0273|nr:trypsin-like peptidase domain-containing protein [Streptomyces griseiscabiei]